MHHAWNLVLNLMLLYSYQKCTITEPTVIPNCWLILHNSLTTIKVYWQICGSQPLFFESYFHDNAVIGSSSWHFDSSSDKIWGERQRNFRHKIVGKKSFCVSFFFFLKDWDVIYLRHVSGYCRTVRTVGECTMLLMVETYKWGKWKVWQPPKKLKRVPSKSEFRWQLADR